MLTPRDAIWQVLAQIQAQSQNEPEPDFRIQAEVPTAEQIATAGAKADPFRLDKIVKMDSPTQPKIDWLMLNAAAVQPINPNFPSVPLPGIKRERVPLQGVQRQPVSLPWRRPEVIGANVARGAQESFDPQTPLTNAAIRMAGPAIAGAGVGLMGGGPVGMAVGGAMGAVYGSQVAQQRETDQGTRAGVNPLEMFAEGAGAALPMARMAPTKPVLGELGKVGLSALAGGGASSAALQMAETGTVDPTRLARETALSGILGTGATVGGRALTNVAESPAVRELLSNETGALGPQPPRVLGQQPDAAAGGMLGLEPRQPPVVDVPDAPEGLVRAGRMLPAENRGVLDPLTPVRGQAVSGPGPLRTPDSMTPSGLTEAQSKQDLLRATRALRRHNLTDEEDSLALGILTKGKDYLFQKYRGMQTSWAQVDADASRFVPNIRLQKGTTLNAVEITALRRSTFGLMERASDLSQDVRAAMGFDAKAAGGDAEAATALQGILTRQGVRSLSELKLQEFESLSEATTALKSLSGAKSEVARSLNSLKSFQQKRAMNDADFLTAVIDGGGDAHKAIAAMRGMETPLERYKYIRGLSKPNAVQYWHWYARTAYLSGFATQARNLLGNASNFAVENFATRPMAAAIDSVFSPREMRSVTMPELRAIGTASGFLDGIHKAQFFFQHGFTEKNAEFMEGLPPEVFGGALAPNVIARSMGAVDQFFRTVGFHMELHRMATTQAHTEGFRGGALAKRVAEIVDDPTITPDLVKRAERFAAGLTFQDVQSGPAARLLGNIKGGLQGVDDVFQNGVDEVYRMGLSKLGKAGDLTYGLLSFPPSVLIAPFINTPFNILKRAAQYTPPAMAAARAGDRDRMMMAGRGAVGTAMMGAATGLWLEGRLTGRPRGSTQAERDEWYATRKPYSIKIGDQWIPYQFLGPQGMVLGAVANYADAVSEDPRNVSGYFGKLFTEAGRVTVDSTFLRGMQTILQAVMDETPEGTYRERFADRTVTSLLPAAGLMRDIRNLSDTTLRDPEGLTENIKASLPGLSTSVEPRVDFTGKEIQRSNSIIPESRPADPLRKELIRLFGEGAKTDDRGGYFRNPEGAAKGLLTKINSKLKARKQPLLASVPRPLLTAYQKAYGQESQALIQDFVNDQRYQSLDDDQRREAIERLKRSVTADVDQRFVRRYIEQGQP